MPNRGNSKPKSSGRRPRRPVSSAISHPPQFQATKRFSEKSRYVAASATTSTITRGMLLNHYVVNTAGTTTQYRLLSAIRIKSISIWASTGTLGQTVTASVEWLSANGPSVIHSDTSVGTAEPLHVRTRPPTNSLASFWSLTGSGESDALFYITTPANAVVDVEFEEVLQNGEAPVNTVTTNAGVVGTVYMLYLGGATSTVFAPVSYASLT